MLFQFPLIKIFAHSTKVSGDVPQLTHVHAYALLYDDGLWFWARMATWCWQGQVEYRFGICSFAQMSITEI